MRARVRYQVVPRLWVALGTDYNTGLPFQPDLTPQQYAAEYGQVVINHPNFNRAPHRSVTFRKNAAVGIDFHNDHENAWYALHAHDVANLGNTLELIDFGGLFSGNAIGPARQYTFRLVTTF